MVQGAEVVLGVCISLFGCLAIPVGRFQVIPFDSQREFVHVAELVLGGGVSLLGCRAIPAERLGQIDLARTAFFVEIRQIDLSRGKTGGGRGGKPLEGLLIVMLDADAEGIVVSEAILGGGISGFRARSSLGKGHRV